VAKGIAREGQVLDLALSFRAWRFGLFTAALVLLSACAAFDLEGRRDRLLERAASAGWELAVVETRPFPLFTAMRRTGRSEILTVYIEGDGFAWRDPYTPSNDPTPERPVGLRLALADNTDNVLYVARPCQYRDLVRRPACDPIYWTTHRLAPQVLAALSGAIDRAKQASGAKSIELIGYSGGGAAAALLAARRTDIVRLVTIAANLDLGLWARLVHVRPLSGSLDPAAEAAAVAAVPQYHLVGADDEIVTAPVVRSFLAKGGLPSGAMEEVRAYSHTCCWHENWAQRIGSIRASTPLR
jgi:hypothetical protein